MITIYGTTGCPMCKLVKTECERNGIPFSYINDEEVMSAKGIQHVPVVEREDGEMLMGKDIIDYINQLKER